MTAKMTNAAAYSNPELSRAVGKIEGSLAEIRWTNRLLVGGVILLVIKEWLWPLLS